MNRFLIFLQKPVGAVAVAVAVTALDHAAMPARDSMDGAAGGPEGERTGGPHRDVPDIVALPLSRGHDVSRPGTLHGFPHHQVANFYCYPLPQLPIHSPLSRSSVQRLHAFDPKGDPTEPRGPFGDEIRENTISATWSDVPPRVATMVFGTQLLAGLRWFAPNSAESGAAHGISRAP
ncbi:MAG: hypothetical protein OXF88_19840 [Rhodobacteraceae bacterium]|nr:hypothetical protein [Paracoccaceae bacterium]MCY4141792.1 hypothetical protein [Paracoccaceae bacterium]